AVMGNRTKDVNVTVTAVAPECDAVQQITAVTDTFYNVTLNWQPIELGEYSSVSYLIFGDNSQFAIDTTTETSITFERLSVGEHCFNVRALSVGDYSCLSESSDTVCAEIEPIPCNVALAVSASNDGESIFLTWNKPVGVEYFRIYRDDNAVEEVLYDGSYTDSNVVPEVTYCYTIFAYFEDGICNEIVGTACTKIVSGVCSESPVLQVEAVGYSVHLSWTATSESYAYKIFRNDVSIGLTTDTTYYDNVEPDRNYCYRVESLCEYGMFAYSDEECVFVELIPEDDDENGQGNGEGDAVAECTADNLTVYPNPTYGQFFIEGQRIATVRIYNASGQFVAEIDNNESERVEISCAGWNPGLYNVRIISEDGQVATRKISIFR
ncbi:MAG: T9SS type A sorting domain-containing protein, partial [Bacteroidales bacterium]|nr:T9SS type A sorting domain-containing protein [Bacteroidales bacterium]